MQVRRIPLRLPASAIVLAALFAIGHAHAQQIVLTNTRGLDFGSFVANTGGTVVLSPTGVRSRTGGVVLLNSPGAGQAGFNVGKSNGGATNKAVIISTPANGSVRLSSGANSMAVNTFVTNPASIASVPNGGTTLGVGATLTVAPSQPPGNYTGTFSLTVNFQ
ncbi:DUF4402 domain-containing protein [Massilia sp. 9I]|uniref:DUF4402 domain-containing protein n=1 Tax=Massilia sp. 9I TaxID=2653152 RepID=UPI0012F1816B|nr:DUF4402 domain-containing protein [Massilia sp. 9I]VXC56042.1 conserved exported hypothetical protein [Massilia sp. 9I]